MTVLVILLFMFCEGALLTYIFLLSVRVSISIICGLLAGALACYVYKIGVFCMGCIIGWVSNILQIQSTRVRNSCKDFISVKRLFFFLAEDLATFYFIGVSISKARVDCIVSFPDISLSM